MIAEDYVSFEIAKLLEEKGFNYVSFYCYEEKGINDILWVTLSAPLSNSDLDNTIEQHKCYSAPTLQMAMKWLRDVHNLIISVKFTIHGWLCDITKIFRDSNGFIVNINHGIGDDSLPYCDEYEDACEVAIKYCLENLI